MPKLFKLFTEEKEYFNDVTNEFLIIPETILELEHSLYTISEWESKWHKPFLSNNKKTNKEVRDYINCMLVKDVPYSDIIISNLTSQQEEAITSYIDDPMTATWFSNESNQPKSRKIITSEVIYYWMIALNIPFECEHWHLNRLLTLVKVCNAENAPKKKMTRSEEAKNRAALNKARRMRTGSKG